MDHEIGDNHETPSVPQESVISRRASEAELRQAIDTAYEILRRYHDSLERGKRTELPGPVDGGIPVGMAHLACETRRASNLNEDDSEQHES